MFLYVYRGVCVNYFTGIYNKEYIAFFYILHVSTDMYRQRLQNKSFELIMWHIPALDVFISGGPHENDIQAMCTHVSSKATCASKATLCHMDGVTGCSLAYVATLVCVVLIVWTTTSPTCVCATTIDILLSVF